MFKKANKPKKVGKWTLTHANPPWYVYYLFYWFWLKNIALKNARNADPDLKTRLMFFLFFLSHYVLSSEEEPFSFTLACFTDLMVLLNLCLLKALSEIEFGVILYKILSFSFSKQIYLKADAENRFLRMFASKLLAKTLPSFPNVSLSPVHHHNGKCSTKSNTLVCKISWPKFPGISF